MESFDTAFLADYVMGEEECDEALLALFDLAVDLVAKDEDMLALPLKNAIGLMATIYDLRVKLNDLRIEKNRLEIELAHTY